MCMMQDETEEKESIEEIRTKLQDTNITRPKTFSLQRRTDVFYFTDDSPRGILKRVPIKDGTYKFLELQTVLEKSDADIARSEVWSDVPLSNLVSSEANYDTNNNSATKNDVSLESDTNDQKTETYLKSLEKIAAYKSRSDDWDDIANSECDKSTPKTEGEDQNTMKRYKVEKSKKSLSRLFNKEIKKKEPQTDKKLSFFDTTNSSSEMPENNHYINEECLDEILIEKDFFTPISLPSTEL